MAEIIMNRSWAMPNGNTFSIKPIGELIKKYIKQDLTIIDPFVRNSPFKDLCYSNDLDPEIEANCNMDALDFLKTIESKSADVVLFDPPYSPRQVSECYKKMDLSVNMQTTQSSFWGNIKKEISRITKSGGVCITCGWNSGGIGKSQNFDLVEVLLVAHGGWHNDTIVVVEIKDPLKMDLF